MHIPLAEAGCKQKGVLMMGILRSLPGMSKTLSVGRSMALLLLGLWGGACSASPQVTAVLPVPTYALVAPTRAFPTPLATPFPAATPQLPQGMEIIEQLDFNFTSRRDIDLYAPASGDGWPIAVLLHGGGVNKTTLRSLGRALAAQGVVAYVPEYQSYGAPPDGILTGVEDAACAVRFARARGGEYGGDPQKMIVIGHSAGGAFGAVVALAGDWFHGDCYVTEGSAIPDVFIGLDGAYDIIRYTAEAALRRAPAEEWALMGPYAHIGSEPVPQGISFHLIAGGSITELLQDAQAFETALADQGYEVTLTVFAGVDHMYVASGHNARTVAAILEIIGNLR
jgi:acetyl esterase/lipase